ncbi:chemotaxis protein CheA [Terasakiella brassicae]|uniref:Chemotaxis protein CheA n=1 Tax=Terasakiella brassicae TaxID=1634917 RepID=A0A917BP71_9PROT|nr:chemotaxis protein CheA [Terasakiella brassicae]GGF50919.1 chemotaxis protein CheA [Terasakiella brassicae]
MPQEFDLNQFKVTYFEECQDLLETAEEQLSILQAQLGDVDVETLHAIFRCVHSIKGGAGAFNFTGLIEFSHILETTLDLLREGKIQPDHNLVDCLIRSNDVLGTLVHMAQKEIEPSPDIWKTIASELEKYSGLNITTSAASLNEEDVSPLLASVAGYNLTAEEEEEQGWGLFLENILPPSSQMSSEMEKDDQGWGLFGDEPEIENNTETAHCPELTKPHYRIRFVPEPHLLQFANEPLLLARELKTLGDCIAHVDVSRLPKLADIAPDVAYLSWSFDLYTDRSIADIEEVFEFVIDDCQLDIQLVDNREQIEVTSDVADSPQDEALADLAGDIQPRESTPVPRPQKEQSLSKTENKKVDMAANGNVSAPMVSSIRVELDRVDRLVNMVGELVITQSMLKQQADELANNAGLRMTQGFEELNARTRELQESVMAIRMQPVKSVFARMPRLVRELSAKLGKKIDLITSGEMTEVDKTVIEQLMDPLTHMIRNSVDHGVETPDERRAAGKPERARIYLRAEHKSGRIQIEVSDDGRGIDRDRVLAKAEEKGLIERDVEIDAQAIDNLIFTPGFSTANSVSDVSGRGVGMDVVRRNIISLGGRISVFSTPGEGARFLMSLPLTLAVLDGMIVKCGAEKYIIPLTSIIESIHPVREEIKSLMNGGTLVSVRGQYIRIVNLHHLFNLKDAITDPAESLVVIVETERYGYVGIMVDELLGQQQVVIKSLEENYDPIAGVAAATILGNGKVALILDVDGLAEMEHGAEKRRKNKSLQRQVFLTGE